MMIRIPRNHFWALLRAAAICLIASSCSRFQDRATGGERKVLLIGLDGIRVDVLREAATPHIDGLIAAGAFSDDARTRMPTVSGPGWSSMVNGVWAEKHGVMGNNFSPNHYDQYPDFLTRLEQADSEFSTAAFVSWPPLATGKDGGPMIGEAVDHRVLVDGDEMGYGPADLETVERAAEFIAGNDPDAVFVYTGNTDVIGHEAGSLSAEYKASIEAADAMVGRLVSAVRGRLNYANEQWLILICTDHGRRDDGGHGRDSVKERTIFYLASGPTALPGAPDVQPRIVDVAVTALAHMGIEIDPAWDLDGRVVGLEID